ncbi:MAG TPA: hypothetical protein VGE44_08370 [Daejeonella sp.]|uniref:hypothetical protein n=1 Tax=Daejeonella sp. TaxID=2805397 RepID=UPI002ED8AC68
MVKSIAIFGINRTYSSVLVEKLAAHPFRILVLSEEFDDCPSLFLDCPDADIQVLNCPAQTGWEADIIVIYVSAENQLKLVNSIREFVTKKIVLNISELRREGSLNDEIDLESLLPYSRLINLSFIENVEGQLLFSISGRDQDALEETKAILKQAGIANVPYELSESN